MFACSLAQLALTQLDQEQDATLKGVSGAQLHHAVDVVQVPGGGTGVEEENLPCKHSITLHQLYSSTFKFRAQRRRKCHGI